jgi:uncharacterized protein
MGDIKLSDDFAVSTLPSGDLALYSPDGSAKPFVLNGKARMIFERLMGHHVTLSDLETILPNREEVGRVLDFLEMEKVISGWEARGSANPVASSRKPKQINFWVHTTDSCNLACSYCYVRKGINSVSLLVAESFSHQLLEYCHRFQIKKVNVKFAGGEPLMAMDTVARIVSVLRNSLEPIGVSTSFGVITNGTLVSPEIARFLKENKFWASVSLDGVGDFNAARAYLDGSPSFKEVLKGISTLLDNDIRPQVLTVISNENLEGIPSLLELVDSMGLPISFSLSRNLNSNGRLELDIARFNRIVVPKLVEAVLSPKPPKFSFNGLNLRGKSGRCCVAGTGYLALDPDGNLSSCQMTVGQSMANVLSDTRSLGTAMANFRPRIRPSICGKCVWRFACAGGCEVMARQAGKEALPSLHCTANKQILPLLLTIKGRGILRGKKGGSSWLLKT